MSIVHNFSTVVGIRPKVKFNWWGGVLDSWENGHNCEFYSSQCLIWLKF